MGPPNTQAGYWAAHDLMSVALIHNPLITSGQSREEIQTALNMEDNNVLQGFISNPETLSNTPDSAWVEMGEKLKKQFNDTRK